MRGNPAGQHPWHFHSLLVLLALAPWAVGCAQTPGVKTADRTDRFDALNRNAAHDGKPSLDTERILDLFELTDLYRDEPADALRRLAERHCAYPRPLILFALAELSFGAANAERDRSRDASALYLTALVYSNAFLFGSNEEAGGIFGPRHRWACEIYNRSLAYLIEHFRQQGYAPGDEVRLTWLNGPAVVRPRFLANGWGPETIDYFTDAYSYRPAGIGHVNHFFGLGAPMLAVSRFDDEEEEDAPARPFRPLFTAAYPATALLRMATEPCPAEAGIHPLSAELEYIDPFDADRAEIAGQSVPLEADLTTPLAFTLENAPKINRFQAMFDANRYRELRGLFLFQPYERDKIPVVLVHGLMSSPNTWIPVYNELLMDPIIRKRYQFWFYFYPTGIPILQSSMELRLALREAQSHFDPDGTNEAFNQMVAVGHSMGGLLIKTLAQDSGDLLWSRFYGKPFDELDFEDTLDADELRNMFYFEPAPFVKRLVFIATPHRGDDMADQWFAKLGSALISVPKNLLLLPNRLTRILDPQFVLLPLGFLEKPTSIASLSPNNPIIQTLAALPIEKPHHSIIGNEEAGGVPGGSDGIVPYESSHLDSAQSELIVKSWHNAHTHPGAILELARILRIHLKTAGESAGTVPFGNGTAAALTGTAEPDGGPL